MVTFYLHIVSLLWYLVNQFNNKYFSGDYLLPFLYSEIRLLLLLDEKTIRFHVFSYFIYVRLDDWCLFGHKWKFCLELMFKFFQNIVINLWNKVLIRKNKIFAHPTYMLRNYILQCAFTFSMFFSLQVSRLKLTVFLELHLTSFSILHLI